MGKFVASCMQSLVRGIDRFNDAIGRFFSYFNHLLVWLICLDVLLRYFFSASQIWMMELEIYFYAFIFLLGSGFAFRHDKHVRVDVLYARMSRRRKAWIDLLGGFLFLLPWTIVVMLVSWDYALISFRIGEGSSQPGGLPALWVLKFVIFFGFLFLFLQGISQMIKAGLVLFDSRPGQIDESERTH